MADDVKNGKCYGCHVDLAPDEQPDGCVVDYGAHSDCMYATFASGRKRRSKWTCEHWLPITPEQAARGGDGRKI